jgi:hypothetical protein
MGVWKQGLSAAAIAGLLAFEIPGSAEDHHNSQNEPNG